VSFDTALGAVSKLSFVPISVLAEKFNPQNTPCIFIVTLRADKPIWSAKSDFICTVSISKKI
jgi:hypothetical protein